MDKVLKNTIIAGIITTSASIIIITVLAGYYLFSTPNNVQDQNSYRPIDCNVARINLYGEMFTYTKETKKCADCVSSEDIVDQIRKAEKNKQIKAIILNVDSSGGWSEAGEEIANALKEAKKPTVALIKSAGLSSAYFAATGANIIYASDLSLIGSIGITTSYLDNTKKNQKDGLTFNQVSIGKYKDAGNPDKPLTIDEKEELLADLGDVYDVFVSNVAENRHLDLEKVKKLSDGSFMIAKKALDNGLIDKIGDNFEVEEYLSNKFGVDVVVCH